MTDIAPLIVVMGVSAAGKSSVGVALSAELGIPFLDADDLHPQANVAKMAAGIPLDDDDRRPWLDAVAARLADAGHDGGLVVACSALRRAYRDRLRAGAPSLLLVHLDGSSELLQSRAAARQGHFMPSSLVASQLATLEPLGADERGVVVDVALGVDEIARDAAAWIAAQAG